MILRRSLLSLIVYTVVFVSFNGFTEAAEPVAATKGAEQATKTRVVLAGDSTVTDAAGWGAAFAKRLRPEVECVNLASSGQSSKSFRDAGRWKKVLDAKPTFVLIQFGHNDMPGKGPKRETDPATTYRANLLACVREARAMGAQPILVTSVSRRLFGKDGKLIGELKPWAEAAKQVAVDEKVPLVDLFSRSVVLLQELGPEKADEFNPPAKPGVTDRTHLNAKGAEVFADIIVEELRRVSPDFATLLK